MAIARAFSISSGVLAPLSMDETAFAEFTSPRRTLLVPKKKQMQYHDSFFKIYTGLDHGNLSDAGGDLPDVQSRQYLRPVCTPLNLN